MAVFRIPVTLTWPGAGSPGVNVFHLRTTESSGTPGNDLIVNEGLDVLDTFLTAVYDDYSCMGFVWRVGERVLDVQTLEESNYTVRSGGQGFTVSNAPPATAVVVGWRTSLMARRGRGRTFLGPLNVGTIEADGSPGTTFLNNVRAAANAFVTNSQNIAGGAFAVWGQENAGDPSGHVARDITAAVVADKFAVLRSRRD